MLSGGGGGAPTISKVDLSSLFATKRTRGVSFLKRREEAENLRDGVTVQVDSKWF